VNDVELLRGAGLVNVPLAADDEEVAQPVLAPTGLADAE